MTGKDRKLILVRDDLLKKVAGITAREGRTLFSFTNEVFEKAIEAYNMKTTLDEALNLQKMMEIGKSLGFVAIPFNVLNEMAEELYNHNRKRLLEKWYESGQWNGNYIGVKFQGQDPLKVVENFMRVSIWNLDEFSISTSGNGASVKSFSPNLTPECTDMLAKFLEGMFNSLGFEIERNKKLRGIIMMELKKETKDREKEEDKVLLELKS